MLPELISLLEDIDRTQLLIHNLLKLQSQLGMSSERNNILRMCAKELDVYRDTINTEISNEFATIGPSNLFEDSSAFLQAVTDLINGVNSQQCSIL